MFQKRENQFFLDTFRSDSNLNVEIMTCLVFVFGYASIVLISSVCKGIIFALSTNSFNYKGFFNKSATKVFLNKTKTVLDINEAFIPAKVRSMPL